MTNPTSTVREQLRFAGTDHHFDVDVLTAWLAGLPGDAKVAPFTELREVGTHAEVVPAGLTATYRKDAADAAH